ncbi:MAG: pyridoxal phosphate-dependent aminotransferase [Deltaproteobacteria bacterium HGW-Deltaproteobacteria-14]|jgi:N-succinyldiaminopimelate aminotransferase|nr:MAG: pyridoxal phosphate-dependent aminotransferase [Deltaproteobacteria bacterium HGW-Deltaproteobacteria-14]
MPRFPASSSTNRSLSAGVFSAVAERVRHYSGPAYRLHIGDTWREPLAAAMAESQRTADLPHLHTYSPVHGEPPLLDAIVRRIKKRTGRTLDRGAVQVTAGATGALSVLCQTLLDPGDEVLLPAPFWPLIRGIIASRGAVPVQVPLFDRLRSPGFDLERALEQAITPRTVAIYVNSPHNPTGVILDASEAAVIARVARRHDLWVLCDEVYEELWLGDAPHEPLWSRPDLFDRTIAVHSMSKGYGLAGARVGYLHGPPEVVGAVRAVHTYQVYGAARPMQLGAARALDEGDAWLAEARTLYRDAAQATARTLGVPTPAGGTFLFFDARPWLGGAADAEPLLLRCVDEGVLLTPGAASGDAYPTWVRVCFTSVPPDQLSEALARLGGVLAAMAPAPTAGGAA